MATLFEPIEVRGNLFRNRIVMPPMVNFSWSAQDGKAGERFVRHYASRAENEVGMIILEAVAVAPDGRLSADQLGLWQDEQIDGIARIIEACHERGAKVLVQIHHAGLTSPLSVCEQPLSASAFERETKDGVRTARAMTADEIQMVRRAFVQTALRAERAGADGVELHGAHGYLLCQFFSPVLNRRTDAYGGSAVNRVRLAAEIIADTRAQAGKHFLITCRMGCNEPGLAGGIEVAQALEQSGVDLIHVSSGLGRAPYRPDKIDVPEGWAFSWIAYGGVEIAKAVQVPVIAVNGLRTAEQAEAIVNLGPSFAAVGTALLKDAEWAAKAKRTLQA